MANKTVDITVKIKDKFSKQIQKLKNNLRSIQNKVEVDLELDDNGDINWAKMELDQIDDLVNVLLEVSDGDLAVAMAKIRAMDNQSVTVDIDYDDNGFQRRMRNFSRFDSPSVPPPSDFVGRNVNIGGSPVAFSQLEKGGLPATIKDADPVSSEVNPKSNLPAIPGSDAVQEGFTSERNKARLRRFKGVYPIPRPKLSRQDRAFNAIDKVTSGTGGFDKTLKRMFPTMRKWMNLIAALIPMMITFGTGLLGVAAAMGTVAAASGAMLGMGLLGYGDTLSGSMDQAQQKVKDLKRELFRTFQGSIGTFNPITERFMNYLPSELGSLDGVLQGITVFEDDMFAGVGGTIDWLERFINLAVELEPQISQLTSRFGKLAGNQLLDFFSWLTEEAYKNQNAIVELGGVFKDLGMILYNLSEFVSFVAIEFAPLIDYVAGLSNLLENNLARSMIAAAAKGYVLAKSLLAVVSAVKALQAMSGPLGWLSLAGGFAVSEFLMPDASNIVDNDVNQRSNSRAGGSGNTYVMNNYGPTQQKHISEFESIANSNDVQHDEDKDWQNRP